MPIRVDRESRHRRAHGAHRAGRGLPAAHWLHAVHRGDAPAYLHEVKQADTAMVTVRIPGADAKRIHAALELLRAGHTV